MNQLLNELFALLELTVRRTRAALSSYLAIAVGVLIATTAICSLLLYSESVELVVLRDTLRQAHDAAKFDLLIVGKSNLIDTQSYQDLNSFIMKQVQQQVGLTITRVEQQGNTKTLLFVPPGTSPVGQRETLPLTRFQFYSNLKDLVQVVKGTYPRPVTNLQDVVEAMATQKLADKLHLNVGDTFQVENFTGAAKSVSITTRLTAIIQVKDKKAAAYLYAPYFLDESLTVPEETFFNLITLEIVPAGADITWAANYDDSAINITNVDVVMSGLTQLNFVLSNRLKGLELLTSMNSVLVDFKRNTFQLQALLLMLGAPVVAIALYYITMSAGLLVEYQRSEIALLKSRGSSTGQVLSLFLLQGLSLVLPGVIAAPFLAVLGARLIGKAETFMDFTNPLVLPVTLRPVFFGYAALAGLLALLATFMPTLRAARQTVVTYHRSVAREKGVSFIHRYYIDILLLALGGLGYRLLSASTTIITSNATGGLQIDPLMLLTPILLVAGLAFLALRVIPLIFRLFARLVSLSDSVSALFALRQIARTTTRYNGLILILTFTLAIGLFTTSVANAFDRNYNDQAMFSAGADVREQELDYKTVTWTVRPLQEYQKIPGVVGVTPALRVTLPGKQAGVIANGVLLAVDPASFSRVAWWRQDFTPSLQKVIALLAANEQAILADKNFVGTHGLKIGQKFDINVDDKRVDFVLAGTFNYFPTLYPEDGDQLVANLDYVKRMSGEQNSEVWLDTRPSQHSQVVAALMSRGTVNTINVEDGHTLVGVRKDDPLRTGLFGALSLGFVASSLLSILGFLLYAYMSIQSRSLQFGVLRATGLAVNQLVKALSSEQLSLIGIGIFLGTVLGGGAGWLFTRFLQLSIIARESVPPFLVTVPWAAIAELYLILLVIFGIALSVSVYLLRQMRIAAVLRLGEQ